MRVATGPRGEPSKAARFVVFSWTPEGRALISSPVDTVEPPLARLRRLGGRFDSPLFYLVLLAVAGFALGYAVQVLPAP